MILPRIRTKISLILPRLASSFDGEVFAAARAIDRTLRSAGSDWHDLADTIALPTPEAPSRRSSGPPQWRDLNQEGCDAWLAAALREGILTDWERGFASDIIGRERLSGKQEAIVNPVSRGAAMTDFTKASLWWADRGFSVFPLRPRGKKPLARLAPNGLKDAARNANQIHTWWRSAPQANIGLAIPDGIFVVDLDGPEASGNWQNMCRRHGELPSTLTVITARGKHLYFKSEVEIKNSAGRIGPHIDTRGTGG